MLHHRLRAASGARQSGGGGGDITIPSTGLVFNHNLAAVSGLTLIDDSPNAFNATMTADIYDPAQQALVYDGINYAVLPYGDFHGVSDYLTLYVRMYWTQSLTINPILDLGFRSNATLSNYNSGFSAVVDAGHVMSTYMSNSIGHRSGFTTSGSLQDGVNEIVITRTPGDIAISINGVVESLSGTFGRLDFPSRANRIGARGASNTDEIVPEISESGAELYHLALWSAAYTQSDLGLE